MNRPRFHQTASRAFSLIELLTVIGLVSLLTTLVTPALMSSHRASSLTNAGNRMADMASVARQTALSRNAIMALIISSKPATDSVARQAAIIMQYDGVQNLWAPLGGWSRLPESISVQDNSPDKAAVTQLAALNLKVDGQTLSDYTALVFYPDGRLKSSAGARELNVQNTGETQAANFYKLVFNTDTSAFRVVRP